MTETSLSFESASIDLPKSKRRRREIPKEDLCQGIKPNGDQCSFSCLKDNLYCKRHIPKSKQRSIETNTCNNLNALVVDSSTNTEGTMLDLTTANKLILEFIDDRVEKENQMAELLELYNLLRDQLDELQSI